MEMLLHAGLNNAVSATFLALLVACLSRVLARRPAILHCLWLLVLLKLVTPPLYEVPISWPETLTASSDNSASAEPGSIGPTSEVYLLDVAELRESMALNGPAADVAVLEREAAQHGSAVTERARAAIASAGLWLAVHWMPILAVLWLAGTIATMAISVRRILRFQLLLREARPGSDDIQDWVDELSASLGVGRPPQVWWLGGKLSPMLWALFGCPRLIIPSDLWKGLDQRQRGTLLVHELAHLRRGDHRVRIFELVVTALYWWNPVLWWARQALRDVEEQCCDAWVVWAFPEAAKSYAETLLETLDFLNQSELSDPLLASGFGKVQHLRRRLTMIMSGTTPRLVSTWGALGALSLGALLLPVNATWAQKPEEKKEVRVIVKTDDGARAVFTPAGAIEATGTFVLAEDPTAEVTSTFVVADDPVKVASGSFVFADDVVVSGDDAKSGQVHVVLKTDDSSVSVSADSIEDALKKIAQQIKALKEKSPHGNKEKAQQEALTKILKQLEQIAKTHKGPHAGSGSGEGDGKVQTRVVIRKVEDGKTSAASPETKAKIEKTRARINMLGKELAAAHADLAKLEGDGAHGVTFFAAPGHEKHGDLHFNVMQPKIANENMNIVIRKKVEGEVAATHAAAKAKALVKKIEPKMVHGEIVIGSDDGLAPGPQLHVYKRSVPGHAEEDRIEALEKKLNKLLEEVASLKKSKGD